mmetsp:Transcript_4409/g.9875  ORF Transcript_4409/g.9875 Transcript_4409/m.9875 type:complete len:621 (-) Transcript_4409:185-2047(-)
MDKVAHQLSSSSPSDQKLTAADLKAYLKQSKVSATGDKGTLWWRCQTHHTVISLKLVTADGSIPTLLKPAQLRKAAAKVGVSPIGSSDEMLGGLVDYLKKEQRKAGGGGDGGDGDAASSSSGKTNSNTTQQQQPKGRALAEAVLSLSDAAIISPVRILQLSDPTLQPSSSTADLRKAYLKISLHIHPDRIGATFKEATKAFQVLVTAYETLTSPDYIPSDEPASKKGKKKKAAQISRSNEGCYTTTIHCPRCDARWNDKVEGNPDYYYNIMMQGLKSFHCATCLLKFGCMSAKHRCPHCRKPFTYSPGDYHRKITCSSSRCNRPFGFYLHHMSDLTLRNLREEILRTRDETAKKMAGLKRRAKRAARGEEEGVELRAFAAGLAEECPKCGIDFAELLREGISAEVHLMNCNDEVSHKKQRAKKEAKRKRDEAREDALAVQNDAESKAAWDFLGKNNDQLYLLSEGQLEKEMKEKGLESSEGDDKADMIAALVNQERSLVVRDSGASSGVAASAKSLPSIPTLQRMDADELRSVLASHGMDTKKMKGMTKRKMLAMLEDKVYKNDDEDDDVVEVKLLTNGGGKSESCGRKKPAKKRRRKKMKIEMDSSDEDDSDGDWNPDA